ncbi:MAG: calcium/sodium antiporter [Planctomycetota bacterium]
MEQLIPHEWFEGMHWALLFLIGGGALCLLIRGADLLVEGASGIALRLGISKVIVGATIVSLGTTSPEAAVSVMAAIAGNSGLALGNAVGSVIADTGLIFGIGCLLMALPVERFILNRQGWVQFGSAMMLAVFAYGAWLIPDGSNSLGRSTGIIFLICLAWYMWSSVKWGKEHTDRQNRLDSEQNVAGEEAGKVLEKAEHDPWSKLIPFFLGGLIMVIFFGRVVIVCAQEGAQQAGVPKMVIAGTIVAFGTSLPELMVGITAIKKGHAGMLIGNVVGADVLNILFVIGASAFATPLNLLDPEAVIPELFLYLHLPAMLLILMIFRIFIFDAMRNGRFKRWHGVPLLLIYVGYLVLNMLYAR